MKIIVSPEGTHLYGIATDSKIYQYSINQSTGALSALSPATITTTTGAGHSAVITPDGKAVFVGAYANPAYIYRHTRDTSTGLLSAAVLYSVAETAPWLLACSQNYLYCFLYNTKVYQYSRNTSTQVITALSPATVAAQSTGANDVLISPEGTHLYLLDTSRYIVQYSINQSTGVLTYQSKTSTGAPNNSSGIAMSADGLSLYTQNNYSSNYRIYIFNRDTSTGNISAAATPYITSAATYPKFIDTYGNGSVYSIHNSNYKITQYSREYPAEATYNAAQMFNIF
jgi:6-phosphogluconolactonase (cycloisomerase 2 family)